jgi:hypothetical protein
MIISKNVLILGAVLALTACGGGSGSSQGTTVVPPPPPDQAAAGLWYGTLTFDAAMGSEDVIAIVSEDGQFRMISADTLVQMSGTVAVDSSSLTGTGVAFASPGGTWPDGSSAADMTLTATVVERDTISGAWSSTAMESGTFEWFYDPLYERDSSLSLLEGMWTAYDELGNPDVTFTIQNSGSFDGQNGQGCVSIGQFTIIDAAFNVYQVQSTVSGCGIAGDYSGLAVLADLVTPNDIMVFTVDNGDRAILLGFQK